MLPGPTICEVKRKTPDNKTTAKSLSENAESNVRAKRILVVCVIGGITPSEVTALRTISEQPNCPYHILVLTNKVITGSSFVGSFKHRFKERG